jgi:large subunit ribosomal protein L33
MAKSKVIAFQFKCEECKSLNYTTSKNPTENKDKIEHKKFCKKCRATTMHKETKISKAKK